MTVKILVTGGTVFVSQATAAYFAAQGHEVCVLNRGSRGQLPGVRHICHDRLDAGLDLRGEVFDAVLDVTAYNARDVDALLNAVGDVPRWVMISSSAVYPETLPQPFREDMPAGPNIYWGAYGTDKIAAEQHLLARLPQAYILRPPYLYGPGNELHREAFVFGCAEADRPFFLPGDGSMPLQFFHVRDLCRLMERILTEAPAQHILNTGNPETVSIRQWVTLCYAAAGKTPRFVPVDGSVPQRSYFPFLNYAYALDVTAQSQLLPDLTPLGAGLRESYAWYRENRALIRRKPLLAYIDEHLMK
ncbi:MAG: NAD-dependent epimerase/dehydratase family protein [Clostridia bacterium]|nr:NAD-dependent epimerase/dehydratase family protein [Clostridia bacterium]